MSALCSGCGEPLDERTVSSRGRRPRYHGPACRQRARRARIASQHGAVLAAVAEVESATNALRAALLAGATDPAELIGELRAATNAVARAAAPAAPEGPDEARHAVPQANGVTKSVTHAKVTASRKPARPSQDGSFDRDSVRLVRPDDPDDRGWLVLAGPPDDPAYVGYLWQPPSTGRNRRSRRWKAMVPSGLHVQGGPWNTRQGALACLVDHHAGRSWPTSGTAAPRS